MTVPLLEPAERSADPDTGEQTSQRPQPRIPFLLGVFVTPI